MQARRALVESCPLLNYASLHTFLARAADDAIASDGSRRTKVNARTSPEI